MVYNIRTIARIDIKNDFVIKGIHLEGLRKLGDPNEFALRYYNADIDEIIFMDAVASLYNRNNLFHIIARACQDVFIPITVGGGIRSLEDVLKVLASGADKIAINTQAIKTPALIKEIASVIGSQSLVISIEAKRKGDSWEAYIDNGREPTGIDVLEWVRRSQDLGAGEILLTSVDTEGVMRGFDLELIQKVANIVSIPLIVSGGAGDLTHITDLINIAAVDALAFASLLHYNKASIADIKKTIEDHHDKNE